ncbi:MAG TPA: N-acetylmuramoyl-L-alanine amidase [Gemmatimonadaceae bacterium]|jgi:N-acetylmuramoyl-L-alanine amidase|nr:N-acetylmuramoyl-L-alanine amidase [Gemmatimonadaceae bacterium]
MIVPALVALQIAAAPPLVIRDARRAVTVPTMASASGAMVRLGALQPMLPVNVSHDSLAWYTVEVWGARMQVQVGATSVRAGGDVYQLAAAPRLENGRLVVPVQLVTDVFPDVVPNVRWDDDAKQLVVFSVDAATRANLRTDAALSAPPRRPERSSSSYANELPPPRVRRGRRTIIVDAGHGGVDNGMSGPIGGWPKIYEKDITLAVALKLGERLRARGIDVVYTRTSDTLIALDDRGRIANRAGGDLFISIHVNAASPTWQDPGGARGFETYFLSEAKTEDARRVEQMENAAARFEDSPSVGRDDPLSFILSDMQQNEHLRESNELATMIQQRLRAVEPGPSRGVKQAGFRVLVTAYMPAVLVEIGFGTNAREARYLSDRSSQDAIANAVAGAAMDYLSAYERRVGGARAGLGTGR